MLPDRVSNPGPLTYESGALPIALRGPASLRVTLFSEGYRRPGKYVGIHKNAFFMKMERKCWRYIDMFIPSDLALPYLLWT